MTEIYSFEFYQGGMLETQETGIYPKYIFIYYTYQGKNFKTRRINAQSSIVKGKVSRKGEQLFYYEFFTENQELLIYPIVGGVQSDNPIQVEGNYIISD